MNDLFKDTRGIFRMLGLGTFFERAIKIKHGHGLIFSSNVYQLGRSKLLFLGFFSMSHTYDVIKL